ncbi:BPI fold-containing family B member 3-like [Myiozetetes cayanensis]|uniref:BPI fold-containing family B member 3-like n=1 Tax=Myiozetetes cayanensis TaxID=478635 RepID=UPI00215E8C6D|nr:BPI fold-containing family B member 3-like [Myiozetetes cayanensis]
MQVILRRQGHRLERAVILQSSLSGPKMSAFWTVFLLSSLLAPSQGFILPSLVFRGDTDGFKGSPAGRVPQRPQGGLLGGNLLGGLLGKDGAVGSLLGKDGVVGGLLGKDGAVGSLLGKDGAVGSLLGKDGVVGGLLGKDGAVGGLLGGDGLLDGLLGGSGLLGGDGLLGGLLGGDGLLGGLLDRDGVLGGILGKDGVIDGLLGKDGVVDGLLGKDGLVDTLLDTVLELLIGKNGLLGKNGLVGSLLGRNGEELMGLRIVNNTLPKISLRSLPGFGHQVDFNTQLLVESTSVPGQPLCEQVEVDATMLVQDTWTAQQSNMNCRTVDISIHWDTLVLSDIDGSALLSDALGCNILSARLNVVNSLLGSRNQMLPLGALGDLPPFSILSSDSIQLDLNLLSGNAEGGMVASTQQLPLAATLLLATGRPPRLSLSQDTLSTLLEQVQGQGALNLSITNWPMSSPSPLQGQVPESGSLSVSALFPFIPQLAQALPGSLPLELRVRMRDEPVVAVRDGRATVTLKAAVDVLIPALQTSQGLLFSLDLDIVLNVTPSVSDGKLQTSLALDSIKVTRFPQKLDPSTVSSLTEWLKQILMAVYVPGVNDAVHVSLPLPNVLNTSLRNAEVTITDADEFPGQTSLERYCSGGASMLFPF